MSDVRWIPTRFEDETSPPPRATPDAWIVVIAGTPFLEDPDNIDHSGSIAVGEVVEFTPFQDFGSITVTVDESGDWTAEVPEGATHFVENGDPDTLSFSVGEFVRNVWSLRDGAESYDLAAYTFGEAVPFRLGAADGGFRFVRVEEARPIEWTALVGDDGAPFVAFVRGHGDLAALAADARLGVLAAFDAFDDERISCDPRIHVPYHLAHLWMKAATDSVGQSVAGWFDICEADADGAFPVSGVRFAS